MDANVGIDESAAVEINSESIMSTMEMDNPKNSSDQTRTASESDIQDVPLLSNVLEYVPTDLEDIKESQRESKVEVTKKTPALLNIMEYNDDDEWTDTSSDPESEELEEIFVSPQNTRKTTSSESSDTDSESDVTEYEKSQSVDSDVELVSITTSNNNNQLMKKTDNLNTYGETLPPVADLSNLVIDDNDDFLHIGNVHSIVDTVVTISSAPDSPAYDLETVLFIEKGSTKIPLGEIFDVIGPVSSPFYCVRLESESDIKKKGIESRVTKVFSIPRSCRTHYIFVKQLMEAKYTDASGEDDVEVITEDTSDEEYNKEPQREQLGPNRRRKRAQHQNQSQSAAPISGGGRNAQGQFRNGSSSSPTPSMRLPRPKHDDMMGQQRSLPSFGLSFNQHVRPPGFDNHPGMRGLPPPPPPPFWNTGQIRPWNDFRERPPPPGYRPFRGEVHGPRYPRGPREDYPMDHPPMGPPPMWPPPMGPPPMGPPPMGPPPMGPPPTSPHFMGPPHMRRPYIGPRRS